MWTSRFSTVVCSKSFLFSLVYPVGAFTKSQVTGHSEFISRSCLHWSTCLFLCRYHAALVIRSLWHCLRQVLWFLQHCLFCLRLLSISRVFCVPHEFYNYFFLDPWRMSWKFSWRLRLIPFSNKHIVTTSILPIHGHERSFYFLISFSISSESTIIAKTHSILAMR